MKKVLAVSGGLDSMVLLHQFKDDPEVLVAHFNHGTRPSANDDQLFVEYWAKQYGLPFFTETAQLGAGVSEERARAARYNFLFTLAKMHNAQIFTAHHADDLVETITINIYRGTGWRGLSPFGQKNIKRPLLTQTKNQLRQYAAEHQIIYREDPTNNEDNYLRNRIRQKLAEFSQDSKQKVVDLSAKQNNLKNEIKNTIEKFLPKDGFYQRSWFKNLDNDIATEILRAALEQKHISVTHPQVQEFLKAIRSYAPGKQFNLPGDQLVKLHKDHFML